MQDKTKDESFEVAVRALQGEVELGIKNLALIVEVTPPSAQLRTFFEFEAGISDHDAVLALQALIRRISVEGLPRLNFDAATSGNRPGYH